MMDSETKRIADVVHPSGLFFFCEIVGIIFNNLKWVALGALIFYFTMTMLGGKLP